MSDRILIVNADDYARTPSVSAGIRKSHLDGIVSTTTVMMNLPGALDEIRIAQIESPQLGLGVHLNLTFGPPCEPVSKVQTLLDADGLFNDKTRLFTNPEMINIKEVEFEWRAQIENFLTSGSVLDHIDSHHHIALLSPDLWKLFLHLAEEYDCGVRPPNPSDVSVDTLFNTYSAEVIDFVRHGATAFLEQSKLAYPHYFYASFYGPAATLDHLLHLLKTIPEGISELMCHPGYTDPDLRATSGYAHERERELAALTHPDTIRTVEEAGLRLSTYRQAWNRS